MKLSNLIFYTGLLVGLAADNYHPEVIAVESTSASVMRLSAQTYWSEKQSSLPLWVQVLFFGGVQPVETVTKATLEKTEPTPEEEPMPEEEIEAVPQKPVYVYGDPVPESEMVDHSFYDNAAIIGDSRSQGLMMYGDMPGANLTGMGVSEYNIWDRAYVETSSGTLTCLQALSRGTYDTIYIALGINSLGFPSMEKYYENYCRLIDEVRALQPNAVIYVQNIIPVNETVLRAKNYAECFNNYNVRVFNEYIQRIATEKGLYFLDIFDLFLDKTTGELISSASGDGLHVTSEYAKIWANYLKTHTIDPEVYDIVYANQGDTAEETAHWATLGETMDEVLVLAEDWTGETVLS